MSARGLLVRVVCLLPVLIGMPGARAQAIRVDSGGDDERCLALAIGYEAGNQPRAGQEAVAEVVLNRRAHTAFPKSVCAVVFDGAQPLAESAPARHGGCQFTFACDGALRRRLDARTMAAARDVARAALAGTMPPRVGDALNYHATFMRPTWAATLAPVATIGAHVFYRPSPGFAPAGARNDGARTPGPDHAVIARLFARYETAEPPQQPVAAAQPFTAWGLALTSTVPSAPRTAGAANR